VSRLANAWIVLVVIGVIFVGVGFAKHGGFRFAAIHESEKQIKMAFAERGERLYELGKPEYSLGTVEMMAKTNKAEYLVTLRVTNPHWFSLTALNMFISPTVTIDSLEELK
jgi:hypothetical protein